MKEKKCIMSLAAKKRMPLLLLLFALLSGLVILWMNAGKPDKSVQAYTREEREAYGENMNEYRLSLSVHEQDGTVAVMQEIDFTNRTGETLPNLVLRTMANAFWTEESSPAAIDELYDQTYGRMFSPGGLTLQGVWWQDEIVPCDFSDDQKTVMEIETGSIAPHEKGTLRLHYILSVPKCRYRFGRTENAWQLGNVFPLLSVWQDGAWRKDAYSPIGDPFVSESALWQVSARIPENWLMASSADMKKDQSGVWQGEILCARDFGMVLLKEGNVFSKTFGDVKVQVFSAFLDGGKKALDLSGKILENLCQLYGPYPYDTLTVAQVSFPFGGMEYPAFIMIGDEFLESQKGLEALLAHEIAHQWFYALAGSDQVNDPWQDESMCQWAVLSYAGRAYGPDSRERLKYDYLEAPMEEKVLEDVTPGSPIHYFSDLNTYSSVVYGRGAAFLQAVDIFTKGQTDAFLKDYCQKNPFGLYSRKDFEDQLAQFTGEDLSPLMTDYLDTLMQ